VRLFALIICTLVAAAAFADTSNVQRGTSQLEFRKVDSSASGGATAPKPDTASEKMLMFRAFDIDGDGFISKAEAAGNAPVTLGFDRADRNRDGKLSFAEYDSIGKPRPQKKQAKAKREGSASAGGTKKKPD
jgi:hypothetical protein